MIVIIFHLLHSEDSGISISKSSTRSSPVNSTMEDVAVQSPTNSRIDDIGKRAQDLIERINERRAMDQHVMNSFEEKLLKKVFSSTTKTKKWEANARVSKYMSEIMNMLHTTFHRC